MRSSADCITATCESEFLVHTSTLYGALHIASLDIVQVVVPVLLRVDIVVVCYLRHSTAGMAAASALQPSRTLGYFGTHAHSSRSLRFEIRTLRADISNRVCRQSISDSWPGNLRERLAHLV
jgi:hypothetical protein